MQVVKKQHFRAVSPCRDAVFCVIENCLNVVRSRATIVYLKKVAEKKLNKKYVLTYFLL